MSFVDFHLFSTISGPICSPFIHYNTIYGLLSMNSQFKSIPQYHKDHLSRICHQEDLPMPISRGHYCNNSYLFTAFQTLKVYIVAHATQLTCNILLCIATFHATQHILKMFLLRKGMYLLLCLLRFKSCHR